ncbi:helix-turn-helix domain-containing protein [Micromonospora inyonensis]|uniref:Helix-turn-helix domain-containing protein n=1 Tax=Micromonospora inyonensis TaxID=47866 RepID=A0A1C6SMQ1_9ACTN|nr:helix-turn-helix domain-containing protein [Micromonospora inyonensis]SCL30595.1 Helix-turn-helix domain-containing protein [Micromonospora inyonensis]
MNELPVGRRVAQWRVRRNMTQQQFADRLGRSKSWVDKIERGVRRLERVSSLREVADALRIDLGLLLADQPSRPDPAAAGVEGVRTALSRYHVEPSTGPVDVAELRARLGHAEQSYRHARYPQLLALLPGLLDAARAARAARPDRSTAALLVSGYGLTALALVKVDQGELAWLAADRGMALALATGAPQVAAAATVPLAQVLRHGDRRRPAMETAVVAVHRLRSARSGAAADPSLLGTLLLQAALAAAGRGLDRDARQLLDRAAEIAGDVGAGDGGFGRAAVEAARVVAETALGDVTAATVRHERLTAGGEWRRLPTEHRAAYLLDVARAYVLAGDLRRAGRVLLEAERTARSEVHDRPAVRDLVAVVARSADAPTDLARLAAALYVT